MTFRPLALLLVCAASACSSDNPADDNLRSFEFRHMVAGETTIAEAVESHTLRVCPETMERVECLAHRHGYGDIREGFLTFVFDRGVFTGFQAPVASEDFDTHVGATRWNYGEPCRKESEQTGRRRFVWCFVQGELVLEESVAASPVKGRVTFGPVEPG